MTHSRPQRQEEARGLILTAAIAFVVGAGLELMKARGTWFFMERAALGNISTPWLLMSMLGGLTTTRLGAGALRGLAVVMAALSGFYLAMAWVLQDAWGSAGLRGGLSLVLSGGRMWFVLGLLSGPVLGALGAWLNNRGLRNLAWAVAGLLFAAEPFVLSALDQVRLPVLGFAWWYEWSSISAVQLAAGAACLAVFVHHTRRDGLSQRRAR